MFKILVLQSLYTLSDDRTEYQIRDRLSFMRSLGLALHDPVPDAKTIWLFREQLTKAGAIEQVFERFDAVLRAAGYLAMAGQIVAATVVEVRRPWLTQAEEGDGQGRRRAGALVQGEAGQMDTDRRWTLKRGRKRAAGRSERYERTPASS